MHEPKGRKKRNKMFRLPRITKYIHTFIQHSTHCYLLPGFELWKMNWEGQQHSKNYVGSWEVTMEWTGELGGRFKPTNPTPIRTLLMVIFSCVRRHIKSLNVYYVAYYRTCTTWHITSLDVWCVAHSGANWVGEGGWPPPPLRFPSFFIGFIDSMFNIIMYMHNCISSFSTF